VTAGTEEKVGVKPLNWVPRFADGDPYAGIHWTSRDAEILRADGSRVFYQKDVVAPDFWSDRAVNVVGQKYFRGKISPDTGIGASNRETSAKQLIDRVVDTQAGWAGYMSTGMEPQDLPEGWISVKIDENTWASHKRPKETAQKETEVYFDSFASWDAWRNDLKWLLIHQHLAFNSPVWFNVGIDSYPQCAACFLVRVEDEMDGERGILSAGTTEGRIFKNGSGSGTNLSRIRSSKEWLKGGGKPSGPLSFAKVWDAQASTIKSGGKTRRAAIMRILDIDHPDIRDFIHVKSYEEGIAFALRDAGYSADMDGEAYQHAFFQNANLSIRVDDAFMEAVENREGWGLISRTKHHLDGEDMLTMQGTEGKIVEMTKAYDLMEEACKEAWSCGDPGIQFHTTINKWHTCADEEPIFTSNPCSEYMSIDDTSCNLASLNLRKFIKREFTSGGKLKLGVDGERIKEAAEALAIAMEVIVSNSRYPTELIKQMTNRYRTLGMGFSNLGGMLLEMGIPYDSDEARALCGTIMSLITSTVYTMSAQIAEFMGPFEAFEVNRESCTRVMALHREEHVKLKARAGCIADLPGIDHALDLSHNNWTIVVNVCRTGWGLRNAQATVLAPTGTIAFLMDCDTTGIEPELGFVKYKVLAGGGVLVMPNDSLPEYLRSMGYGKEVIDRICQVVKDEKSIRKATKVGLLPEHVEVFRTSFPPPDGDDFTLGAEAHIQMMAAAQPFVSGAISKTVNLPNSATVEDVMGCYTLAWMLGLKAVAVYRDGSKMVQAVSTTKIEEEGESPDEQRFAKLAKEVVKLEATLEEVTKTRRRPIPKKRVHGMSKFTIDQTEGYIGIGFYPDSWKIGEVFVTLSKQNSTVHSFTAAVCKLMSKLLQYGMPLDELVDDFLWTPFHPSGPVLDDPDVRSCTSILDYVAKKMKGVSERVVDAESFMQFFAEDAVLERATQPPTKTPKTDAEPEVAHLGESCPRCGSSPIIVRGRCKQCPHCGFDEGGCFS